MLIHVEGPGGGGKSQLIARMLAAGEVQIVSDVTMLWAALSGAVRDPETGLYPVRLDDDPALALARYLQATAVRQGLEDGADVAVTSSAPDQGPRWERLADDADVEFQQRTVDPGRAEITRRLTDQATGILSDQCANVIRRWYG